MSSTRVRLALILLTGMSLAGCAQTTEERAEPGLLPSEQFLTPVTTDEREFALVPYAEGLSPRQRDEVGRLVADWRAGSAGPIVIKIPARAGEGTLLAADRLEDYLRAYGLSPNQVERVAYDAGPGPGGFLRIGFVTQTVHIPKCGVDQRSYTQTFENRVSSNFGCAVSANIAVMVANPADLVGARPEDPADAGRRQVVLEKYRNGELTSSEKDEQADGSISDAVK